MKFTGHARHRAQQMDLDIDAVMRVLIDPDRTYYQTERNKHYDPAKKVKVYQRYELAVVVDETDPQNKIVVTVLWRDPDVWRARVASGRAR